MFIFIDNSFFTDTLIDELTKKKLKPILVYTLKFENKHQIQKELTNLEINKNYPNAVLLQSTKTDSFLSGFIAQLNSDFDLVLAKGGTNKLNRFYLEQTKIDILVDPHSSEIYKKQDFIHHYNSGLNHVLVKIAKEKNIILFNSLNFLEYKYYFKDIIRIEQNISLCQKYGVSFLLGYFVFDKTQIKSEIMLKYIYKLFSKRISDFSSSKAQLTLLLKNKKNKKTPLYLQNNLYFIE